MTTMQIRHILHQVKEKEHLMETQALEEKMKFEKGLSFIKPESELNSTIYKRAIATFTKDELNSLNNYGDLIIIDPTYCNLISNWSVGPARNILSAGCIFCSNVTSDVFEWILNLLIDRLPCSSILKTIVSDDDVALDSAFSRMKDVPIIACLKRIICIWHKYQKFKELVNKLSLSRGGKKINQLSNLSKLLYNIL